MQRWHGARIEKEEKFVSVERRLKFHVHLKKRRRKSTWEKRNVNNDLSIFFNIRLVSRFVDRPNDTWNYINSIYIYIYETTRVSTFRSEEWWNCPREIFVRRWSKGLAIQRYIPLLTCAPRVANLLGAALERESWWKKHLSFPIRTRFGYYVRGMAVMKYRRNLRRRKNSPQESEKQKGKGCASSRARWTWTESYFSDKLFSRNLPWTNAAGSDFPTEEVASGITAGGKRKTTVAPDVGSRPNLPVHRFSNLPLPRISFDRILRPMRLYSAIRSSNLDQIENDQTLV